MTPLDPRVAAVTLGSEHQGLVATRLVPASRWRTRLATLFLRWAARLMRVDLELR